MSSAFHQLCPRYSGPWPKIQWPMPLRLLGYGKLLPFKDSRWNFILCRCRLPLIQIHPQRISYKCFLFCKGMLKICGRVFRTQKNFFICTKYNYFQNDFSQHLYQVTYLRFAGTKWHELKNLVHSAASLSMQQLVTSTKAQKLKFT